MSKETKNAPLRGVCRIVFETEGMTPYAWAFLEEESIANKGELDEHTLDDEAHILKNGDRLTICLPGAETTIVWSGEVCLEGGDSNEPSRQKDVNANDWSDWFFGEYPAELAPAPVPDTQNT